MPHVKLFSYMSFEYEYGIYTFHNCFYIPITLGHEL